MAQSGYCVKDFRSKKGFLIREERSSWKGGVVFFFSDVKHTAIALTLAVCRKVVNCQDAMS